jgi:hypothetical protein
MTSPQAVTRHAGDEYSKFMIKEAEDGGKGKARETVQGTWVW